MQYMRDQFRGRVKLSPADNARYAGLAWTSVHGTSRILTGRRSAIGSTHCRCGDFGLLARRENLVERVGRIRDNHF
jgi:hypothetical protein